MRQAALSNIYVGLLLEVARLNQLRHEPDQAIAALGDRAFERRRSSGRARSFDQAVDAVLDSI